MMMIDTMTQLQGEQPKRLALVGLEEQKTRVEAHVRAEVLLFW